MSWSKSELTELLARCLLHLEFERRHLRDVIPGGDVEADREQLVGAIHEVLYPKPETP